MRKQDNDYIDLKNFSNPRINSWDCGRNITIPC